MWSVITPFLSAALGAGVTAWLTWRLSRRRKHVADWHHFLTRSVHRAFVRADRMKLALGNGEPIASEDPYEMLVATNEMSMDAYVITTGRPRERTLYYEPTKRLDGLATQCVARPLCAEALDNYLHALRAFNDQVWLHVNHIEG